LFKSFRSTLSTLLILSVTISSILTGTVLIFQSNKDIEVQAFENTRIISTTFSDKIDIFFNEVINNLEVLANSNDFKKLNLKNIDLIAQKTIQSNSFIEFFFLTNPQGMQIYHNTKTLRDVSDRDYFKQAMQDKTNISEVLISKLSHKPCVYIATPIKKTSTIIGTLTIGLDLTSFSALVQKTKVGINGELFVVDRAGKVIAHKNPKLVATLVDFSKLEPVQAVIRGVSGINSYNCNGENMIAAYAPVKRTSWGVIAQTPNKEITAKIWKQISFIIITLSISILIALLIAMLLTKQIIKPLIEVTTKMEQASNGDFTGIINVNLLERKDEFGRIASAYQLLSTSTKKIINSIGKVSNQIIEVSDHTCISSHNLTSSAQNQLESSLEMTKIIKEIAESIDNVAENCTRLADSLDNSTRNGLIAKDKAMDAVLIAKKGQLDMDKFITEINVIKESTNLLSNTISEAGSVTTKIKDILELLENISKQTSLISITTSIEAFKVGEAGKGFTIIADKIGKFSEDTSKATQTIAKLLEKIEIVINNTISKSNHNVDEINKSINLISDSGLNFEQIYHSIQETTTMLQKILTEIELINIIAQDVAGATEEQSASSEEVLATIECINELSKKVTLDSKIVKTSANSSNQAANELQKIISFFKTN